MTLLNKFVFLLILSVLTVGCGTGLIKAFVDAPEVKRIELKSFSMKDQQAVFEVLLYNPNSFSVPITKMMGDIVLNEIAIGNIDIESDIALESHATQKVSVPIMLNSKALIKAAKKVFKLRQAQYTFNGGVMTSAGELKFSTKGDLSMKELISTFFNNIRL